MTLIKLDLNALPTEASSNCTQELTPINAGELNRTINGELIYIGEENIAKFRSTIRGQDTLPIALDNLWRGKIIEVQCLQPLAQSVSTATSTVILARRAAISSVCAWSNNIKIPIINQQDNKVTFALPSQVSSFIVTYRPIMQMMIVDFGYVSHEWDMKQNSWYLDLEEV